MSKKPPKRTRRIEDFKLIKPVEDYGPRLALFGQRIDQVFRLKPEGYHLWEVMDGVAFQDTETALETAVVNAGEQPISETLAVALTETEKELRDRELSEVANTNYTRGLKHGKSVSND